MASLPLRGQVRIEPLSSEIQEEMVEKKTWAPGCPVPLERLRQVVFSYIDFEGKEHHDGELIVLDVAAPHLGRILETLHQRAYPIHSAKRIEFYGGIDEASMAPNNSVAFNYRLIAGSSNISIHSYGLALDINPAQNPCVTNAKDHASKRYATVEVSPKEGVAYLNRSNQRPGMIDASIVALFAQHGFRVWGGTWNDPMDFQHFQTPRWLAELLTERSAEASQELFDHYVAHPEIQTKDDLMQAFLKKEKA